MPRTRRDALGDTELWTELSVVSQDVPVEGEEQLEFSVAGAVVLGGRGDVGTSALSSVCGWRRRQGGGAKTSAWSNDVHLGNVFSRGSLSRTPSRGGPANSRVLGYA